MQRILLTGASGHLGAFVLLEAQRRGLDLTAWTHSTTGVYAGFGLQPVDLTDGGRMKEAFPRARPHVVIHAAALSALADCHRQPDRAKKLNIEATRRLLELSAATGARFIYTSTDLVFDGARGNYCESDEANPLSIYAQTKLAAERYVLIQPGSLVVRLGWLAGPKLLGQPRFFDEVTAKLRRGEAVRLFADEWRSPLGLPDAAAALIELAERSATGLLHLGGPQRLSRFEMGLKLAGQLGVDPKLVVAACQADLGAPEPRPRDVSLDSTRWRQLCPLAPWREFAESWRLAEASARGGP